MVWFTADLIVLAPDCTPYLLSLGLTKSQAAFVWVAGPISGLIVQPIVGVIADESRSRFGRRRPIIIVGSILVALSLLALGFTKEIVATFVSDKGAAKAYTIALAILALCSVDFAINAGMLPHSLNRSCSRLLTMLIFLVMSCARSLVVDTLDISRQQAGAAMGRFHRALETLSICPGWRRDRARL